MPGRKVCMKNVSLVADSRLCTGCGGCSNICPRNCIVTELDRKRGYYVTRVDESLCISCGLCQKVCPVYTWTNQTEHPLLGRTGRTFSVYASDDTLRQSCASGGFTTSLLCYLLEQGLVDAVVAVGRDEKRPLMARPRICTNAADIVACKGSVYAPTSYSDVLKELLESTYQRVAVVGLPCHIQTVCRLEKTLPKLKNRIVFKISLVCGHTPSLKGYAYSLRHLGIDAEKIQSISNRGDGWPGYFKVVMADQRVVKVNYRHWLSWGMVMSSVLFTPDGCAHCVDPSGYEADISVSDAWLPRFRDDHVGRNLIYVRSAWGYELVQRMQAAGKLVVKEEEMLDFVRANDGVFKEKLVVNGVKNRRAVSKGLFPDMKFLPVLSEKDRLGIRCFIVAEKSYKWLLGTRGINKGVLFVYKVLKYCSLRWLKISY